MHAEGLRIARQHVRVLELDGREPVARWAKGERAVQYLVERARLDAVAAQFAADIPEFAKPTFERFRRTRHSAQYFDPDAAPITESDASWAIGKAIAAVSGVSELLASSLPPGRFD